MRGEGWTTLVVSIVGLLLFLVLAASCQGESSETPEPACTGEWCQDMYDWRQQQREDNQMDRDR